MFFADIETHGCTPLHKAKDSKTAGDLFAFLTMETNAALRGVHPIDKRVLLAVSMRHLRFSPCGTLTRRQAAAKGWAERGTSISSVSLRLRFYL